MPEVIFTGPAGRIEGRYHPARQKNAPIVIVQITSGILETSIGTSALTL